MISKKTAADGERDGQRGLFDTMVSPQAAGSQTTPGPAPQPLPPPDASLQRATAVVADNAPLQSRKRTIAKSKIVDDKSGHRARLLTRFRDGGADPMPDYELLEMVLFRVFPRGDTKSVAKALMVKFKSFSEVVSAPPERLMEVAGIGQRAVDEIKLIRAAALRMMQSQLLHREVLNTWPAVLDYCRAVQGHDDIERFRILFLDKRNQLIADQVQQSGTVDHTPVYIREIIKRALQLGATALVLVHNHPSGDPSPSRADIDMTRQIVDAARPLNITVHYHVIDGRNGHFSFRAAKMI